MHYVDLFSSNTGRRTGEYEVEVSFICFVFFWCLVFLCLIKKRGVLSEVRQKSQMSEMKKSVECDLKNCNINGV